MKFYCYPGGDDFGIACRAICVAAGFHESDEPRNTEFAIAPLLIRKLTSREFMAPRIGTLIFHPSALPYRRGPDAIRQTIAAGERVTAATWFWCEAGLDTGAICEQELVVLHPDESHGRAYHTRFIPAGLRALRRAVDGIANGCVRCDPQDEQLATYDGKLATVAT